MSNAADIKEIRSTSDVYTMTRDEIGRAREARLSELADRLSAVVDEHKMLLAEVSQCATELEEAANIIRPHLPGMASLFDAAAKRASDSFAKATGASC